MLAGERNKLMHAVRKAGFMTRLLPEAKLFAPKVVANTSTIWDAAASHVECSRSRIVLTSVLSRRATTWNLMRTTIILLTRKPVLAARARRVLLALSFRTL